MKWTKANAQQAINKYCQNQSASIGEKTETVVLERWNWHKIQRKIIFLKKFRYYPNLKKINCPLWVAETWLI